MLYRHPSWEKSEQYFKRDICVRPPPAIQRAKADSGRDVDYHDIVHEKASTYDLDPSLIKAVIKTESNWNDRAVSSKGAMGLMQLMPGTANDLDVRNPFDPEQNIEGGTKYLKHLIDRFNGDLTLALAAYNAGPNKVAKYGYVPPITETQQYVKKVLSHYNGTLTYPVSSGDPGKPGKKSELIYKIVMEDGSVLFTNFPSHRKNPSGFKCLLRKPASGKISLNSSSIGALLSSLTTTRGTKFRR